MSKKIYNFAKVKDMRTAKYDKKEQKKGAPPWKVKLPKKVKFNNEPYKFLFDAKDT